MNEQMREAQPVLYMARNLHSSSYATSRNKAEAELFLSQSGLKNDGDSWIIKTLSADGLVYVQQFDYMVLQVSA